MSSHELAEEAAKEVAVRSSAQLSLWSIGHGFEGTASDWTEYVVWLLGFISLMWFVWSRNINPLPEPEELDEAMRRELNGEGDSDDDEEGEAKKPEQQTMEDKEAKEKKHEEADEDAAPSTAEDNQPRQRKGRSDTPMKD
mmetsp:Transcript_83063/g.173890  ORF Transcript_83063/g.173890 Transcript_83063/m.173890 type:complete len:140 (-) Transcript_83063:41-460(-)